MYSLNRESRFHLSYSHTVLYVKYITKILGFLLPPSRTRDKAARRIWKPGREADGGTYHN